VRGASGVRSPVADERTPRTSNFSVHLLLTEEEREQFLDELGGVLTRWMQVSQDAPVDERHERDEYVMVGYGAPQWAYDEGRRRRERGAPPG